MAHRNDDDTRIRDLFRAAREADAARTPSFRSLTETATTRPTYRKRPLRLAMATAATVTVACAAAWLGLQHGPPTESVLAVESEVVEAPASPPQTANPDAVAPSEIDPAAAVEQVVPEPADPAPVVAAELPEETPAAQPTPVRHAPVQDRVAEVWEPVPSTAPTATGSIVTMVQAPDGKPLPGATVTISHPKNYVKKTAAISGEDGIVEFPVLRPGGDYALEIAYPGFAELREERIRVPTGGTATLPVRMLQTYQEAVRVAAARDVIDLEATASTTQFSDNFISDLSVPGRFYQNVITLAPGVQDADGDGNPNVHGARDRDFKAEVSGITNVDALTGQWMSRVDPNSIEEMEVVSAGAGVEYGRASGGFARVLEEEVPPGPLGPQSGFNTESYDHVEENDFHSTVDTPLSTFSVDVDTASYANVRRFLNQGQLPPPGAVRIEEMVNYFRYDDPYPTGDAPFAATIEVADAPWRPGHRLARIGIRGKEVPRSSFAGTNLVFLIDVSGSMKPANKLPLLKQALRLLAEQLDGNDRVAIVVYAGSSGLVLPSTSGADRAAILESLRRLKSGGSTNGASGLKLAYRTARENYIEGGVNRVVLATDGDFNVGVTNHDELLGLIERDARNGIYLTALGFGMGNYKDDTLELLADKGNGNYAYIDNVMEARKVLVDEIGATLVTIAKDVKIQVEFNPAQVASYRLIGYENRRLAARDFNDDKKDAGEIGSGHTLVALYEIVPAAERQAVREVDDLRYQYRPDLTEDAASGELFTLNMRYKDPDGHTSRKLTFPIRDHGQTLAEASRDFKFAAAVAAFGMVLRDSPHRGDATLELARRLAEDGLAADDRGYRKQFLGLVRRAVALGGAREVAEP